MKKLFLTSVATLICCILFSQNVGIGASDPVKAKLIVRGTVGYTSAIFGDTTTGIAIENDYPGIGINSYYSGGRRSIANGFGGHLGMDPVNGDFSISTSTAAGTTGNILATNLRLLINKDGNVGIQGVSNPLVPLSFANSVGNNISLWGSNTTTHYGIGLQGGLMQLYADNSNSDIAFGYGSSGNFTENMRIKGTGNVGIGTNTPAYPVTLNKEGNGFVQKGTSVEIGTATTATAGIIKTFTNHALQFFTGNNATPQFALTYNGRVGIGTNAPTVKFEIKHNDFDMFQLTNTNPLAAGEGILMNFRIGNYYTGTINSIGTSATTARLSFSTGSSSVERMAITSDGKVGINTTNPSERLEVNGTTKLNPDAGSQTAVIVNGMMKISSAFVVSQFQAGMTYVVIDNPYCNNNPNAILMVTPEQFTVRPVSIFYDNIAGRWRINEEHLIFVGEKFHVLVMEH